MVVGTVGLIELGMWDVKFEMRNVECGMRNVECEMWNVECEILPSGSHYNLWATSSKILANSGI